MWIPRKRQPWVAWLQEQTRHHVMPQAQCDLCTALVLREKEASAGLWPASLVRKHSTWRGQKKPHYLWKCWTHGGCCLLLQSVFRGAGSLCLLNQKRISFESRTEAVLWYVWRGVKVDCRKKKLTWKNASECNSNCSIKHVYKRLTSSKLHFQFSDIIFWFHLAFIFLPLC